MSAAKAKKRLRPGELDDLVLTYIGEHKAAGPLTASTIGKGIGRSSGAVAKCLARLAKEKKIRQAARLRAEGEEAAMCRARSRQLGRCGGRKLFPGTLPPPLNYAVVTGKVLSEPREGRGPSDDPVTLLEIEFPVAHPEHRRFLWAYATYDVEVPGDVGGRELEGVRKGASIMILGQRSERLSIEDGRTGRHPVIVAALIHAGPPEGEGRPLAPPPPGEAA